MWRLWFRQYIFEGWALGPPMCFCIIHVSGWFLRRTRAWMRAVWLSEWSKQCKYHWTMERPRGPDVSLWSPWGVGSTEPWQEELNTNLGIWLLPWLLGEWLWSEIFLSLLYRGTGIRLFVRFIILLKTISVYIQIW